MAKLGDEVRKGETLALLDSPEHGEAEAQFLKANAKLKVALAAYKRQKLIHEKKIGALKDVESAEADDLEAKAELDVAEQKLRLLGFSQEEIERLKREGKSFHDTFPLLSPFARRLVLERLQEARERIPEGFGVPIMGPNTTGLGQVFQYSLKAEDERLSLMDLRALQDWTVRLLLRTVPGVDDVLSFGGHERQYQVLIKPAQLIKYAIGFIAVFGVAMLNGVVLVTYFKQLTEEGLPAEEAVRRGCLLRLRPVLMTATVAILGLVPLLLAKGIGAEVQRPLATVVVGGLFTSTLLTLILLPVVYLLIEGRADRKRDESQSLGKAHEQDQEE